MTGGSTIASSNARGSIHASISASVPSTINEYTRDGVKIYDRSTSLLTRLSSIRALDSRELPCPSRAVVWVPGTLWLESIAQACGFDRLPGTRTRGKRTGDTAPWVSVS
jgi:hypothetical protein